MNISGLGGLSPAAFAETYGVNVERKAQESQQIAGQSALQLISSAQQPQPQTQPLQAGQTINVFA